MDGPRTHPAAFQPCKQWQGPQPGFVFKAGPKGVGYYEDALEVRKHGVTLGSATTKKRKHEDAVKPQAGATNGGSADSVARDEKVDAEDEEELIRKALESDDIDEETIKRILEAADRKEAVELDLPGVKRLVLGLEKKISSNQHKRVKYADDPSKFLDSELELYEEIGNFKEVAAAPQHFLELVNLGTVNSLLGLVTHENTDMSISAMQCIAELTDPDVVLEAEEAAMTFVDALVDKNALELLVQNLQRLDENREEDAKGILSVLQVLDNLFVLKPSLCSLACSKTDLLKYLTRRITPKKYDDIKGYCAELLAVILQADTENQRRLGLITGESSGLVALLIAINFFRRREPTSPDEAEFVANLFNALSAALLLPENQTRFREAEGLDLMLRCLREKRGGMLGALKGVDVACTNSPANCGKLIELGGLKVIFPLYMGRGWGDKLKGKKHGEKEALTEHIMSTIASLCSLLESSPGAAGTSSDAEARVLSKFVLGSEGQEKVDRAVELFTRYYDKVEQARGTLEQTMDLEGLDEDEKVDALLSRLLDSGLYLLQRVSVILGFVYTKSREGRERVLKRFHMEGRDVKLVAITLKEYAETLGEGLTGEGVMKGGANPLREKLLGWAGQIAADGEDNGGT